MTRNSKNKRIYRIIGLISLTIIVCFNWVFAVVLLFSAFIIWIISIDIQKDTTPYISSYNSSARQYKMPSTPLEWSASPPHVQKKAVNIVECIMAYIDDIIDSKSGLISSNALFSFWGVNIAAYQSLHKKHLDNLIKGVQKLGYGVVPNYQHGNKRLDYNEHCVLYRLPKNFIHKNTSAVHQAKIFLKLLSILMNGQQFKSDDLDYINRCFGELTVSKEYHGYLNAYILWLIQKKQPYDKKTKDEVAELPSESKRVFVNLLTEAVSINGCIDNNRMEALKKILPTLDTDSASAHSLVHQSLTDDEFATIETKVGVTEYTIRQPDQKKLSALILDEKKLSELKQQTEIAQGLLSEIFIDEEVDKTTDTQTNNLVIETLQKLLERDTWQRSEVMDILGSGIMLGNVLEQINDYSYSIVEDIVVEEDGDTIYVTTEYKEQLI